MSDCGVRRLGAAFWTAVPWHRFPESASKLAQFRAEQSGSKLPHSKALQNAAKKNI